MKEGNLLKLLMWLIIAIVLLLITASCASALDECQDIETTGVACEVVTPVIDCSTYDSYNPSHTIDTNDGAMTQIGSTGIYYFTFNETTADDYVDVLPATAPVSWDDTNDPDDIYSWITTDSNIVQDAELDAVNSSIISHGDINWTTGTVDGINATEIAQNVWNYNISGITADTNTAAGIIRLIKTAIDWIERLLG